MNVLEAAYKVAASIMGQEPTHVVVVSFRTAGFRWTTWHQSHAWNGATYVRMPLGASDLGENLVLQAPRARLQIGSVDGSVQAWAAAKKFRGDLVDVALLWWDAGTFRASGYARTYRCDSEQMSGNVLELTLCSSDAAQGVVAPLYTTTEAGCQVPDFRQGACWYRPVIREGAPFPDSDLATRCDRSLDGPLGCLAHFRDVNDVNGKPFDGTIGARMRIPLPFQAFPGSLDRYQG